MKRALFGCLVVSGLGVGIYATARLAWADHLSRSQYLADRLRAVRLAPSATLYERLADRREQLGGDPLPDLQHAAALEPENAVWPLRVGLRAELAGDLDLAEQSYLRAVELSRLYQPRYLLAQYYFRRQNADRFREWSRAAFSTAYDDVGPLLDLCWRIQPDAGRLLELAPSRPEIAGQFLGFLARRHRASEGRSLALQLSASARAGDLPMLLEYCNQSLYDGDGGSATAVWNALCTRRLLPDRPLDAPSGGSLTNGNFEHAPSGTGFDWRMERPAGVEFLRVPGGMRLTFSGSQPERCLLASQYVPVLPGRPYRLRLAPSVPGLDWLVSDPAGHPPVSDRTADGWLTFHPATEVVRLGLFYQRPAGATRLEGTITIAAVELELVR